MRSPSGMPDRLTCCSSSDSMSPPNGKAPDHDGRGLDCPVLVGAAAGTAPVLLLAALGEGSSLVDLGGELFGEGVVQVLAVGVLVEGGGVGEDRRAALD